MKNNFEVVVGNIGTVYNGPDEAEAKEFYKDYAELSRIGYGRCAGEPVTLCESGKPVKEWDGAGYDRVKTVNRLMLLPCPFCGAHAEFADEGVHVDTHNHVYCSNYECQATIAHVDPEELSGWEAAKRWNRRTELS